LRLLPLVLAGLASAYSCTVRADVLDAVNWARLRGCSVSAPHSAAAGVPLKDNPKLQRAAARLAGGAALPDSLASLGYLASESAMLHFSGAVSDAEISHLLAAHYCRTLTDSKLKEIGAERRGADVWMVLAAPVAIPGAADAPTVSARILDLVNAGRAAGHRCGAKYFAPSAPLALNANLTRAALAHSREMAANREFDHRGHDGSTPADRIRLAGYGAFRIVGENIAAGAMTPAEVTEGWFASPAHCENIMDARFTEIGIAYAANLDSAAGLYWTQDFAAPR
jgi:uncharacterized protein YkwD